MNIYGKYESTQKNSFASRSKSTKAQGKIQSLHKYNASIIVSLPNLTPISLKY
jgi:hypothetical protein